MSYNVEGIFDLVKDGTEYPEYVPGNANWNVKTWRIKIDNIASVIAEAKPSVVIISEIENKKALSDLVKILREDGMRYPYSYAAAKNGGGATTLGILSRCKLIKVSEIEVDLPGRTLTRPILEAKVACGGTTLTIFGVHFPSQLHPESYRIAAAKIVRQKIEQLPLGSEYLVAGDFNEGYDAWQAIEFNKNNDCAGQTALNDVLKTASGSSFGPRELFTTQTIINSKENGLVDLWITLPLSQRFSYIYQGRHETLDHMLLSRTLFDSSGISFVSGSFLAFKAGGRLLRDDVPFRWQVTYSKAGKTHVGEGYSDHLPVMATFARGGYRDSKKSGPPLSDLATPGNTDSKGSTQASISGSGWQTCCAFVTCESTDDQKLFTVKGMVKNNGCVVQARIASIGVSKKVTFVLKGRGKLDIRTRVPGSRYCYYNGPTFKPSKSGRYTPYSFDSFHRISIALPEVESGPWELEIRGAKGGMINCIVGAPETGG